MSPDLPVSVVVVTRDEARRLPACLDALRGFPDIVVVDSGSIDGTPEIARASGARVVPFVWDGRYPKKRQWCLDHLALRDWVFFVDADEIVTPELKAAVAGLFAAGAPPCDGYFVPGRYVIGGRTLRFGLCNAKLALFDRRRFAFPVVDDLDLPGMGEIEGHYQPVARPGCAGARTGRLSAALCHHAYDDEGAWDRRHCRYAAWERGMNARGAWPRDPVAAREALKTLFRAMPGRAAAAFVHSYLAKGGFLDGMAGYRLARDRFRYYRMITARGS